MRSHTTTRRRGPLPEVHEHQFVRHFGIRIAGNKYMAWVPWWAIRNIPEDAAVMERCVKCDEQGYLITAGA